MLKTTYIILRSAVKMKELRQMIRELREDHDLSQKTVAEYLNVKQQTYSNYENGHRQIPASVIAPLASFYNVSTDYLLNVKRGRMGSVDLGSTYLVDVTMYDVMCDIQRLKPIGRSHLYSYLQYLTNSEKYGDGGVKKKKAGESS